MTAGSAQAAGPEPTGPSQWLYWCPSTITLTLRGLAAGRQPRARARNAAHDHKTRAGDCPASARVPSLISRMVAHPASGQSGLLLWDEDGTSWAECDYEPGAGNFAVSSYGPRRLRAEAEDAFRWWVSCGHPPAESFGRKPGQGG